MTYTFVEDIQREVPIADHPDTIAQALANPTVCGPTIETLPFLDGFRANRLRWKCPWK